MKFQPEPPAHDDAPPLCKAEIVRLPLPVKSGAGSGTPEPEKKRGAKSWFQALLKKLPFRRPRPVRGRSGRELALAAIEAQAMLRIRYEGHVGYLDVEPHALGRDADDRLVLLCFEIAHPEEREEEDGWHGLAVADFVAAYPTGEHFAWRPLPPNPGFETLIAQARPGEGC